MLDPSDKERLATLEADIPWIKDALGRLDLGQKELHKMVEDHLIGHRNGSAGTNGQNGGVTIVITKKALVVAVPIGSTTGLWAP